jgi:hypothetical protein
MSKKLVAIWGICSSSLAAKAATGAAIPMAFITGTMIMGGNESVMNVGKKNASPKGLLTKH